MKVDIAKLYREKKYSEIISIFDNKIPENQKNSLALVYLGLSRILKGDHSNKNFILAINDFKKATLKEKRTRNSLEAFKNFINVSVELFNYDRSIENHQIVYKFFKEILSIYDQDKDFFSKDEFLMLSLVKVQTILSDLDKVREYCEDLIKNKFYRPKTICALMYNNCFVNNWKQEDFLKYGRLLSKNIEIYESEKLKLDFYPLIFNLNIRLFIF